MEKTKHIYHVGPLPDSPGGIATVIGIYLQRYQEKYGLKMIGTYAGKARLSLFAVAVIKVSWICLTEKEPLFHIHISKGGSCLRKMIIATICNLSRKDYILHIHGGQFLEFIMAERPFVRRYIVFIFNRSRKIVTLANYWKAEYDRQFNDRLVTVIPNPCPDFGQSCQKKSNPVPVILFIGLLCPAKGIYDLIDAIKIIVQTRQVRVRIFGNGEVDKVTEYAAGIDGLTVSPWVERKKIIDEYKQADIFLLPSYIEGLPMVILEAMSCGLPIIATNVGGIPEMVHDGYNGFLLMPGDIAGLVEKLMILIDQKNVRESMGENSLKQMRENYALENLDRQIAALYSNQ